MIPSDVDEQRWTAITRRDRSPGAPGFVYAVKTTGVYCRPGCSSRQPKRANVVFFTSGQEAERAGFRACKRCKPNATTAHKDVDGPVLQACQFIDTADEPPALEEVAAAVRLSPSHLHRQFKAALGVTPKEYAMARQWRRLQDGLQSKDSVTRAIYSAGFGSSSRVYSHTREKLGMTPTAYKNGAAGVAIRFAIVKCSLGWLLVAATERGICRIEFGDSSSVVRRSLANRFPKAHVLENDPEFAIWVQEIVSFIELPQGSLNLPIDIQGTAFQHRVWLALQEVPLGTTVTYAELARRIGRPSAVRAVGSACGANPVAIIIPCHRALGKDGKLHGYRWGLQRKKTLLEREGATEFSP